MAASTRILGPNGQPLARPAAARPASGPVRVVRGRYDAAQSDEDTRRHWANADGLSARNSQNIAVRTILRNRSRYESANNSYCRGIVLTLANDAIGTGPRLQMLTDDEANNEAIEEAWTTWTEAIGLPELLRTMCQSRIVDGEAFGRLVTNPKLSTPVQLDLKLIEGDQIATPQIDPLDLLAVDGIIFDDAGNPTEYHVLERHPGDLLGWGTYGQFDRVPAELILHWFRTDRPGQTRGLPEITPALPLFAQLRRYTLAVLAAAETAADFAAVLESDAPGDDEAVQGEAFETLEIEKRMLTVLPAGQKLNQFKAEQPVNTYEMFKREILNEIARCLSMPFNVAAGNSSGYNYASGRLDHQVYFKAIRVDQSHAQAAVLDPLFAAWLREAALATKLVPGGPNRKGGWPHKWMWHGEWHVDPLKEASAQQIRLQMGTTTVTDEYAKVGLDVDSQYRKLAHERALRQKYGLPEPGAAPPLAPGAAVLVPGGEEDDDEEQV